MKWGACARKKISSTPNLLLRNFREDFLASSNYLLSLKISLICIQSELSVEKFICVQTISFILLFTWFLVAF
jgi:hypothetical protein